MSGLYLKKPFTGKLLSVRSLNAGGAFEIAVHFDDPVDVVDWESFSALRQRVKATVSANGVSWTKTSDGEPHMRLEVKATSIV